MAAVRLPSAALIKSLAALPGLSTGQLRAEWQRLHGHPPPARLSPDLLRRGIGHKLQETALGGLPPAIRRKLVSIAGDQAASAELVPPSLRRSRLRPGATLIREWRGQIHTVLVQEGGYEHRGRVYTSLSEIARAITGAHWSGPRFFGLQRAGRVSSARRETAEDAHGPSA